jgi:hypothetical protein
MSSIVIAGNTSGAITIAAPAEAGLNTLTLPASTGTVALTSDIPAPVTALVQTYSITASSQSLTGGTTTNMTGLSATITPSTTSKRIKVSVRWAGEFSANRHNCVFGIKRGSTAVGNPAPAGLRNIGITTSTINFYSVNDDSTPETAIYSYVDSPATTSATTYYATVTMATSVTVYHNQTVSTSNSIDRERLTSSITLEEVD